MDKHSVVIIFNEAGVTDFIPITKKFEEEKVVLKAEPAISKAIEETYQEAGS